MKTEKWYEDNKEMILSKYYDGIRIEYICSELECCRSYLYRKFNEWEVERRKATKRKERYNAKYAIDANYFDDINTEHKAYWLGMIVADGFVNDKEISLCLKKRDIIIIEKFKADLQAEHPIKYNKDGNPFITIPCSTICKRLFDYGLHNRKSWDLDIEKVSSFVPKDLENHFVRGMFDGDGSIKIYNYPYLKKPQYHFGYTGLFNVCQYVDEKVGANGRFVFEGNKTYTLVKRRPETLCNIREYLYRNATIYLDRKYETFKTIQG